MHTHSYSHLCAQQPRAFVSLQENACTHWTHKSMPSGADQLFSCGGWSQLRHLKRTEHSAWRRLPLLWFFTLRRSISLMQSCRALASIKSNIYQEIKRGESKRGQRGVLTHSKNVRLREAEKLEGGENTKQNMVAVIWRVALEWLQVFHVWVTCTYPCEKVYLRCCVCTQAQSELHIFLSTLQIQVSTYSKNVHASVCVTMNAQQQNHTVKLAYTIIICFTCKQFAVKKHQLWFIYFYGVMTCSNCIAFCNVTITFTINASKINLHLTTNTASI